MPQLTRFRRVEQHCNLLAKACEGRRRGRKGREEPEELTPAAGDGAGENQRERAWRTRTSFRQFVERLDCVVELLGSAFAAPGSPGRVAHVAAALPERHAFFLVVLELRVDGQRRLVQPGIGGCRRNDVARMSASPARKLSIFALSTSPAFGLTRFHVSCAFRPRPSPVRMPPSGRHA